MPHKPLEDMTLHELGQQRDVLDVFLAAQEGEADPDLENMLEKLQGTRDQKVERWGRYLLALEAKCVAIGQEIKRLQERRDVMQRAYEASRAQLLYEMQQQGITEVRGTLCDVRVQLNNPRVVVPEVDMMTLRVWASAGYSDFVREVPAKYEIDKKAILNAVKLQPDMPLPEGVSVVRDPSLRIK